MEDLLSQYAARFAAASLTSLVDSFNSQVGNRGWTSARACHNTALIREFKRRGVDVSSVSHGDSISFAHHVQLAGNGSPDKPRGLSIQPCKSEKEEPYIRHSSQGRSECLYLRIE